MKKQIRRRFFIFSLLVLMILLLFVSFGPAMKALVRVRLRFRATEIIQNAIMEELENGRELLENAVTMQKSDNGKVTSLVANSYLFSIVKEKITQKLLDDFSDIRLCKTEIPIFIDLFPENSLTIPFRFRVIGVPTAEIHGFLSSYGINQTHYQILLSYSVEIAALFPFSSLSETVSDDIILTEIVFSGEIPNAVWNR